MQEHVTALRRYSVVCGTMGGTSVTWYRSALSSRVCGSATQQFSHLVGYISTKTVTCSTGTSSRLLPRRPCWPPRLRFVPPLLLSPARAPGPSLDGGKDELPRVLPQLGHQLRDRLCQLCDLCGQIGYLGFELGDLHVLRNQLPLELGYALVAGIHLDA